MSRFQHSLLATAFIALLAVASEAQTSDSSAPLDLPLPTTAVAEQQGAIEPADLRGNLPSDASTGLVTSLEPPLPESVEPQAEAPPAETLQENSAMPRRFRYALNLELRGVYDDNVTLSSGANKRSDFSGQIAAGIVLGFGDVLDRRENFVAANYSPSAYFYVDNSEFNTFEHTGRLQAQWRLGRFTLSLGEDFASVQSTNLGVIDEDGGFSNQTNLDVGGRRRITRYSTNLFAAAALTGKVSIRVGASYDISDPEDRIGSESFSGTIGLKYQYSLKVNAGLDFTAGESFIEGPSPNRTFEQINLRANYALSAKMNVNASAGFELRQSEDGSQDRFTPIFRISGVYQPFDGTDVSFSTSRRTFNSASSFGQDFTSTQVVFNVRQRFFQRMHVSLAAGYQNQTYFNTVGGLRAERDDNYFFVVPGIDVRLTEFWSTGAFYSYRRNDSSLEFFSFNDNQIGLRSGLSF